MAIEEESRTHPSSGVKRTDGDGGVRTHQPLVKSRWFEQLKQRNVFRVAALYLVVCWLILEPVHVVFHMLDVPVWANRLVLMIMAVGFPAVLIFAWVYEVTPDGLKPTVQVPHGQSIRRLTGRRLDRAIIAVLAVALAYFALDKFWISKHPSTKEPAAASEARAGAPTMPASAGPFSPPPLSIAILPFINLSGDQSQEYFSDGLTEELLNSLAEINGLQVAARTSAFSFKGKDNDINSIARRLNVADILEGSVRRSDHTVRVTAQLINAVTGFHVWSKTYDRELGDVLKLQTDIATEVANALKVTLLGDEAAKIEVGGTRNPTAFDAYLRATKTYWGGLSNEKDLETAIAGYTEAIRLDSKYALAYSGRSLAVEHSLDFATTVSAMHAALDKAQADARKGIELAPSLSEGHVALAVAYEDLLEFTLANEEFERALTLAPGNARTLWNYGLFAVHMGRLEFGLTSLRRALMLDPLNVVAHSYLGSALFHVRRYPEAIAAYNDAETVDASGRNTYSAEIGFAYLLLGDYESARSSCERRPEKDSNQFCLAIAYDKLGRHADAEAMLAKSRATDGDTGATAYSVIYAHWGNKSRALDWLDTAARLRDPSLELLKGPWFDPLRNEPRYRAVERALKFPY